MTDSNSKHGDSCGQAQMVCLVEARLFPSEQPFKVVADPPKLIASGLARGVKVEELYREVRALRIYEGASEVQKLIIARQALATFRN